MTAGCPLSRTVHYSADGSHPSLDSLRLRSVASCRRRIVAADRWPPPSSLLHLLVSYHPGAPPCLLISAHTTQTEYWLAHSGLCHNCASCYYSTSTAYSLFLGRATTQSNIVSTILAIVALSNTRNVSTLPSLAVTLPNRMLLTPLRRRLYSFFVALCSTVYPYFVLTKVQTAPTRRLNVATGLLLMNINE